MEAAGSSTFLAGVQLAWHFISLFPSNDEKNQKSNFANKNQQGSHKQCKGKPDGQILCLAFCFFVDSQIKQQYIRISNLIVHLDGTSTQLIISITWWHDR